MSQMDVKQIFKYSLGNPPSTVTASSLQQPDIASVQIISFFFSHIVYYNSQYYAVVLLSDLK